MTRFYRSIKEGECEAGIICDLCFRHCKIHTDSVGFCGVQENRENKLFTTVMNYPSALNIDPIEKKPLYHFLPGTKILSIGTVGCNLRCPFCQNSSLSFEKKPATKKMCTVDIMQLIDQSGVPSIAFTYNEPTMFWPWAREISIEAHKRSVKTVLVSNGEMSETVVKDMIGKIDAANIDVKTGSVQKYSKILKGDLETVFKNTKMMLNNGIWVELTTLIVPGFNDTSEEFISLVQRVKKKFGTAVPWHISAFHPAALYKDRQATTSKRIIELVDIAKTAGISYCYSGNILDETPTKCNTCGKILIQRHKYDIINNGINTKGICNYCGSHIEGVFK